MFRAIIERLSPRPDTSQCPPSASGAICEMIQLRKKFDVRLTRRTPPQNWIMRELYRTPEALIYNNIELYGTLIADGHDAEEALRRIKNNLKVVPVRHFLTIEEYLFERMKAEDPQYLEFSPTLLPNAINIATDYAQRIIERRTQELRLTNKHLKDITNSEALSENLDKLVSNDEYVDSVRILVRTNPSDELYYYSTPSLPNGFGATGGIALVRDGEVVDHVTQWVS